MADWNLRAMKERMAQAKTDEVILNNFKNLKGYVHHVYGAVVRSAEEYISIRAKEDKAEELRKVELQKSYDDQRRRQDPALQTAVERRRAERLAG
jgi:predicted HTH transcriptional regulator